MLRLLPIFLVAGCSTIEMPAPLSFPSACGGDKACETRKNAETLSAMGYTDAGLVLMCADDQVQAVLEKLGQCGHELFYLSTY